MSIQRKVQQIGKKGSFIITLPKDWCHTYDVIHGSELAISVDHLHPGSILISLPNDRMITKKSETSIKYSQITEGRMFGRMVLGSYLDGYEVIRIVEIPDSRKIHVRQQIKKIISKLYISRDTEIIDKTIEIHVSNEFIAPLTVISDLFLKAKNMVFDAFLAWETRDEEIADDIIYRDEDADKLYFYIVRILKKMLSDPLLTSEILKKEDVSSFSLLDTLDLRMIASYLENLADSAEVLAQSIINQNDLGKKFPKKTRITVDRLIDLLTISFNSYITKDQHRALDIVNEIRNLLPTLKDMFFPPISLLIQELAECIIDIADLVGNYQG